MDNELNPDRMAWDEGYYAPKSAQRPYEAGSTQAWSWCDGRGPAETAKESWAERHGGSL